MRIGFDVDGVLANFFQAYEKLTIQITGKDLFGDKKWPNQLPQTWNWPETFGYTKAEMNEVWKYIKNSPSFWTTLWCLEEGDSLKKIQDLTQRHEVYFITDRPGIQSQSQTMEWLDWHGLPTAVIISGPHARKGRICYGLNIDYYIDDKFENVLGTLRESPQTKTFMLRYPYNYFDFNGQPSHDAVRAAGGIIIDNVGEFIDAIERA